MSLPSGQFAMRLRGCEGRRRASACGLDGLAHVTVLFAGDVGAAGVAEVEERLRIPRAPGLAEITRNQPAHVPGNQDPELRSVRSGSPVIVRRIRGMDPSRHDGDGVVPCDAAASTGSG